MQANEVIDFIESKINKVPVIFTTEKLNKNTVPKAFFCYEVSFSDGDVIDYDVVAQQIDENFAGTVLSLKPIDLNENAFYKLKRDKDLRLNSKTFSSIDEFLRKYG